MIQVDILCRPLIQQVETYNLTECDSILTAQLEHTDKNNKQRFIPDH